MGSSVKLKKSDYNIGALVVLMLSIGVVLIAYSGGILVFNVVGLTSWILGPLSIYTVLYALWFKIDRLYYLFWGLVMMALALSSSLSLLVHPLIVLGLFLMAITLIGFSAYWRRWG